MEVVLNFGRYYVICKKTGETISVFRNEQDAVSLAKEALK